MRLLALALLCAAVAAAQSYDLVVRNARIWTGDRSTPFADSIAVLGGRVIQVGAVPASAAATRTIDARGRLLTPGFIDSHIHIIEGGLHLTSVQLRDARTRQQFVDRIRAFAATQPEGAWITGGDWDHELWGGELPTRQWIDAVTPRHPVWVNRLDGHMALANSLAIARAGVTAKTRDVPGGTIVRNAKGEPTGVFKDNAMSLVEEARPPASAEAQAQALRAAMDYLLTFGVTTAHHMGTLEDLALLRSARNDLKLRIYAAAQLSQRRPLFELVDAVGRGDAWLRWGMVKGFQDGSLGSRTAAMEEDYSNAPGERGLLLTPPQAIYEQAMTSYAWGLQVAIHAIGDRANHLLLDAFQRAANVKGSGSARSRIEHAQHLRAEDIPRFAKAGVIASMQPYHAIDDGRWAESAIGPERAKTTYAFRSLLDAGAVLAFGSDWFVAPPNVMEGIYAAVTRRTLDGKHPGGWIPEQKITVEEALRAYTWGGAYAAMEEDSKGVLAPGRAADFVILDRNILEIPPGQIRDVKVMLTVVDGRVAFERR